LLQVGSTGTIITQTHALRIDDEGLAARLAEFRGKGDINLQLIVNSDDEMSVATFRQVVMRIDRAASKALAPKDSLHIWAIEARGQGHGGTGNPDDP